MKKSLPLLFIAFLIISVTAFGQGTNTGVPDKAIALMPFSKIIASPRVNVILARGDKESVRIIYNAIPKNKVNIMVKGNTLRIYLDHARVVEKQVRRYDDHYQGKTGLYSGSSITAIVTYRALKSIEIRGDGELRCDSALVAETLKLRAYGENEISLASVHATKFKASLYGENELKIRSGETERQVYRLFGENKVLTLGLKSEVAATRIFGEGRVRLSASDKVRVNALGEPIIFVEGTNYIRKGIVIGRADIRASR